MTFRDLEYLIAEADHGHFGQAAKSCHITQSTLSLQLQKLEAELGVQLVERTNRRVVITARTPAGNAQYRIDDVVQKSFHKISHRIDSDGAEGPPIPDADILHHKIDKLLLGKFRYLLDRLEEVELADGTLLIGAPGGAGIDQLISIESLRYTNGTVASSAVPIFTPLQYTASNADLIRAFGTNANAATKTPGPVAMPGLRG